MAANLEKQIIKLVDLQKIGDLQKLIAKTPAQKLIEILEKRIGHSDANLFWNSLLRGFDETEDSINKRFACVKAFLKLINKVELSYKQTFDLITRLFLDFPSFPYNQLIEIVEFSIDSLKLGDPKCVGWKDLLPELINILATKNSLPVNGVRMTGADYRSNAVKNLCTMKWPTTVLTPIANMFRDMKLSNEEILTVLTKFCYSFKQLDPIELPPLAFQLFSMCNTAAQIVIPIIALQRYFYKHYYKKLYADMESESTDFDSIDKYSDKELREAEETILHHLNYCTQFKISEQQILIVLRSLQSSPDVILTPFFLSSILSVARINRDPDNRLSPSAILPFLRNVIANNEEEKEMLKLSAWCRDTLQTRQVNINQILTVLIDQNKEGKDVVTPGLVNLAFTLLRTPNAPNLNSLATKFLEKFVRKRFVFGQGIVKAIAEWMILEQDSNQYSECLITLSMMNTFTVSECLSTIRYVLDFLLCIPGLAAMRMISFILPIIRISHVVRDSFIEVMKKAMYSREPGTCKLGVYGFCMLLKLITNNNSQRAAMRSGNILTQQSISGFSLMSQTTLGNRNNPQRHFDMLTLEVIGILRNCFNHPLEIKNVLYESLSRAIDVNPKLIPHMLQYIDWHFRSYFEMDETRFEIKFDRMIRPTTTGNEIEVSDNLGKLTKFIVSCVMNCDKHELNYDTKVLRDLFAGLMEKIVQMDLEQLEITGTITHKMNQTGMQFVGLIESLMIYALWTSKPDNENVKKILELFKYHQRISKEIKELIGSHSKKTAKKGKANETVNQTQNVTINGSIVKRVIFKPEPVCDLPTIERFLRLVYDDYVSFADPSATEQIRSNRHFVHFVTQTAITLVENLRNEPDYRQVQHSCRCLKDLTDVSKLLYDRCIKRLPDLWNSFDVPAAYLVTECFHQTLITANTIFKRKLDKIMKEIDFELDRNDDTKKITAVLQNVIEAAIKDEDLPEQLDGSKIPVVLFKCLEIVYDFIPYDDRLSVELYRWIFKFCQTYELNTRELAIANKILFAQRIKTHTGQFFATIATQLKSVFQKISGDDDSDPEFELKSITEAVAEPTLVHLMNVIRKQIADTEYFITKTKSLHAKIKITSEDDREQSTQHLKNMERSICSQLVHISSVLLRLTNTCIPLGTIMDNLVKILMEFYICITNLAKHFTTRHSYTPVSLQGTKFDQVLRICGKPLAGNIYEMITYIEANILDDNVRRQNDPKADKAKVLKETKLLPKLILRMENYNKFVILLSKKTQAHITHYLHIGTVRDFRIKTSELKEAIDKSLSHASQIDDDDDNDAEINHESESDQIDPGNQSDMENEILDEIAAGNGSCVVRNESETSTNTQVLKNLEKVNAKTRKKRTTEKSQKEEPATKKPRTRRAAKNLG